MLDLKLKPYILFKANFALNLEQNEINRTGNVVVYKGAYY